MWLLAWQALVFAVDAAGGAARSPYGLLFRRAVSPRIGPATEFEAPRPPRFAQAVGLAFALVGLVGYATGTEWLGQAATGGALAASFLNAVFGYCLGARCTCSSAVPGFARSELSHVRWRPTGARDENLAALAPQGWFPVRSWGTICETP